MLSRFELRATVWVLFVLVARRLTVLSVKTKAVAPLDNFGLGSHASLRRNADPRARAGARFQATTTAPFWLEP